MYEEEEEQEEIYIDHISKVEYFSEKPEKRGVAEIRLIFLPRYLKVLKPEFDPTVEVIFGSMAEACYFVMIDNSAAPQDRLEYVQHITKSGDDKYKFVFIVDENQNYID